MVNLIAGLVLAAGAGTRIGQPKAAIKLNGERLVDRSIRLLKDAGCSTIFVVLGAWVEEVENCIVVVNPNWADGMSTSLKSGLNAVTEFNQLANKGNDAQITHVLITLVDLPKINVEILTKVLENPAEIVVASYQGVRGHPVKIAAKYWQEVGILSKGDEGARGFLRTRSDVVEVSGGTLEGLEDIDTHFDLNRLTDPGTSKN